MHIRVTPGVEAHTHEFIETGTEDSKFGFGLDSGEALAAVQRVVDRGVLQFAGIHCHIGSQVFRLDSFERAVEKMVGLVARDRGRDRRVGRRAQPRRRSRRALPPEDAPPTIEQYATVVRESVGKALADAGVRSRPRLMTEPGRSIVAPAGITLYTVGTIKAIDGVRTYVAVDGGMSDNLRPVTYGARYEAFLPARATAERSALVTIAGKHCEQGDIIVRDARLPGDLAIGEILATPVTGAYGHVDGVQLQQGDAPGGRVRARRRGAARRAPRDRSGPGPARHRRVTSPHSAALLPFASPTSPTGRGRSMMSTIAADARLAAVAVAQHGVFTRAQAIAAGFGAAQIERRVRAGVWVRVLPRVYRHAATPVSGALAAVGGGVVGRAGLRALAHERGRDLAACAAQARRASRS